MFNKDYISGGSSSGSAVAVASGLVSFALGTDTAGSGRIPAAFNNIVGLKPTKGLISARGVVPACRTQDTVSIFSLTVADVHASLHYIAFDHRGQLFAPYLRIGCHIARPFTGSHRRSGAPLEFFGDALARDLYEKCDRSRAQKLGARDRRFRFRAVREAAKLLYRAVGRGTACSHPRVCRETS